MKINISELRSVVNYKINGTYKTRLNQFLFLRCECKLEFVKDFTFDVFSGKMYHFLSFQKSKK